MNGTIKVLCYKSKTLSNGEHPLMLCVCKDNKRKYLSLGISVSAEHWDFKSNLPNDKCPNRGLKPKSRCMDLAESVKFVA